MDLWAISLERQLTEQEICALLRGLPQERRERLERVRCRESWREPLCAYGLLRLAVRETWGWARLPALCRTERGKPMFIDCPEHSFNLSHTEGAVLVGLGNQPIGVDVEQLRPLSKRVFHRLEETGQTLEAYYEDWVRYEASVKCRGAGVQPHHRPEEGADARLIPLAPGFVAAVCGEPVDQLHRLTLEELLRELKNL